MEASRNCSASRFSILVLALTHWCSISMASCTFTISNYCSQPIWPGTLAGAGTPQLSTTGFRLDPGQSVQVAAPTGWSGRMWARTGCVFDAGGNGKCQTGDCEGRVECAGTGATPPATLFEITLGKGAGDDKDYYDVSLVDGYNLPVVAVPQARQGGAGCNATGCAADLNRSCPKELQVDIGGGVVACRSACEAFGQDQYCCSGAYATPTTCRPTAYSSVFKSACPRAYSYAYDDGSSTFTCTAADYAIAFCLPPTGLHTPDDVPVGSPPAGGSSPAGSTPPPPPTDNNGVRSTNQPPPTANSGSNPNVTPPPPTDNSGAGSFNQPPPTTYGGGGSINQQTWMIPSSASTRRNHLWLLLTTALLSLFWSFSP